MKRLTDKNFNTPERYNKSFIGWIKRQEKERAILKLRAELLGGYEGIIDRMWGNLDYSNERRMSLLTGFFEGGKLIDLGCLNSCLPVEVKKKHKDNAEVWALDFSSEVVDYYTPKYPGIKYVVGDVRKLEFEDNMFDYVVAGELLEHMEDPAAFIREAMRILKDGGIFALSTPNDEKLGEVDAEEHIWGINSDDLKALLSSYGVTLIAAYGGQSTAILLAWCRKNEGDFSKWLTEDEGVDIQIPKRDGVV